MIKFENSIDFKSEKERETFSVKYDNLMELCQGGPEIGNVSINGILIEGYRFGGPMLLTENVVYMPMFKRGLFSSGFVLVKIVLETGDMIEFGKVRPLIYLDRIECTSMKISIRPKLLQLGCRVNEEFKAGTNC